MMRGVGAVMVGTLHWLVGLGLGWIRELLRSAERKQSGTETEYERRRAEN